MQAWMSEEGCQRKSTSYVVDAYLTVVGKMPITVLKRDETAKLVAVMNSPDKTNVVQLFADI